MTYDFCIPVWCYDKETFSIEELYTMRSEGFDISWTGKTCKFEVRDTNLALTLYGIYSELPKIDFPLLTQYCVESNRCTILGSTIKPTILQKARLLYVGRGPNDPASLVKLYWEIDVSNTTNFGELQKAIADSADILNANSNKAVKINDNKNNKKEKVKERKENKTMANLFGNIKVGKAGANYSITYFGTIAYKGKTYYNNTIYDAQGMTINFDMLYLIPSAEVKKGDIIDKDNKAYYVLETNNGVVKCINLEDGKEENLVPGGPFGMTMYSKLFNPMGQMQGENSFGNILMMQALCGNDGYGSGDNSILLAMMMMQGGFKFPTFQMPAVAPTTTPTENKN